MNVDIVRRNRDLRRYGEKSSFDAFFWVAFALLLAVVTYIYHWEASNGQSDIYLHAALAAELNFLDPHSITSRIAYPFWHLNFAVLYQLGVPYVWAATAVCVAYKMLGFLLVQRMIFLYLVPEASVKLATLAALAAMFVTAVRIPSLNPAVYIGVGSPTVWHNPTQIPSALAALLCVAYTAHCVSYYREQCQTAGAAVTLPWKKILILAVLLLFSAACKPTFLQAYLPACGAYFLVLWLRNKRHTRYFLQILLAFLPAALFFLMQYLYYTGVVVPFTSGVAVSLSLERFWLSLRNMLMMTAFPLFALVLTDRKDALRDPAVVLCLLVAAVGVLEAALFYETGVRENHGNFNWASMTAALLLWVFMLPRFINDVCRYRHDRQRLTEDAKKGAVQSEALSRMQTRLNAKSAGFLTALVLLLWHLYSAIHYLYYLFSTGSVF